MPMVRTQISLPEEQYERAKRTAQHRGISFAELVRRGLQRELADEERQRRIDRGMRGIGGFRSGRSDGARHHDDAFDLE